MTTAAALRDEYARRHAAAVAVIVRGEPELTHARRELERLQSNHDRAATERDKYAALLAS